MTLDDSLRGVRDYCARIGLPTDRFGEVRSVYNKAYSFHVVEHAVPFSTDTRQYQLRCHELLLEAQARAAALARDYAKKELTRNDLAARLRLGGAL